MQVFFYCSCFEWRLVHRLQIHRNVEGSSEVLIIIFFFKKKHTSYVSLSTHACDKYHLFRDFPVANSISDLK